MLYSSKKEMNALAEHGDLELDERGDREEEVERPISSPGDPEQKKLDPLEGLDEPTRICFLVCSWVVMWLGRGFWGMTSLWPGPCFSLNMKTLPSAVLRIHFLKTQSVLCRIDPEEQKSPTAIVLNILGYKLKSFRSSLPIKYTFKYVCKILHEFPGLTKALRLVHELSTIVPSS